MTTERMTYCMGCMKAFPKGKDKRSTCPLCGFSLESYDRAPRCIRLGSILKERYLIGRVLGEGSFGITYIGRDMLLDQIVAIKEYFPINHVSRDMLEEESDTGNTVYVYAGDEDESYKNGLEKFYNEAKILAKFHGIAGVVSVINFFYANGTAYLVMEYVDGITLKEYIKEHGPIAGERVLQMIHPVIKALSAIHKTGIIHRDISPDNILVNQKEELVLIDFGSARAERQTMTQSMTVLFKHGYTPEEQYRGRGNWGAWSDVYSLCATMYFMLTGIVPNESIERMIHDDIKLLRDMPHIRLSATEEDAIMRGMAVKANRRFQSMESLEAALYESRGWVQRVVLYFQHKSKRVLLAGGAVVLAGVLAVCALLTMGGKLSAIGSPVASGRPGMTESKTASGQAIRTDHADETNAKASAGAQKNNPATSTVGDPQQTADAKQTVTPKKTAKPKRTTKPKKSAKPKRTVKPKSTARSKETVSPQRTVTATKKPSKSKKKFVGVIP